jgi:hypothetical protein
MLLKYICYSRARKRLVGTVSKERLVWLGDFVTFYILQYDIGGVRAYWDYPGLPPFPCKRYSVRLPERDVSKTHVNQFLHTASRLIQER